MPRSPNGVGKAGATRTAGLSPRSMLPRRTTRYNSGNVARNSSYLRSERSYLLLRRRIETYELSIHEPDAVGEECYEHVIELAPNAARRLVANLTAALRVNGHWKD